MYEFHYYYIENKYGSKSRLVFTVTDNLVYKSKTKNLCYGFSENKETFDFSNYSAGSKYYNDSKALVVGKMKDETGDVAFIC